MSVSRLTALLLTFTWAAFACAQPKELKKLGEAAAKAVDKAVKKGSYRQADSLCGEYVSLFRKEGAKKDFFFSEILVYQAKRAAQEGQTDKAIEIQGEVVEVRRTAPDCTFLQWASAMSDLASYHSQKGDYDSAIATGNEAMRMLREKVGKKHQYYNIAMANQATFYSMRGQKGDADNAVALGLAALDGLKKSTPEYATALNSLAVYYSLAEDWANANKISVKARKAAKKRLKDDPARYATVMNTQAVQLAKAGNYAEAVAYAREAKESFEKAGSDKTLAYAKLLNNMATFTSHRQNYVEAAQLLETAMPIIERVAGKRHPDYLRCVSDLAGVYRASGNLSQADRLANQVNDVNSDMDTGDNEKNARALSRQAAVFASNGNFVRAIENEQKAFFFFKERDDKMGMAQSMGYLASYFAKQGKQDMAYQTAEAALEYFRQMGKRSTAFAQALNNTAIICYNANLFLKATDYGRDAMKMYEQIGDTATAIYARILANNALFSFSNGNIDDALEMAVKSVELQKRVLGDDHPENVKLMYNLAVYCSKAGMHDKATQLLKEATAMQAQFIRSSFLHLTSQERENFWQRKRYVFQYAPMMAYMNPNSADMATMAYNSMLFTKSILLNSEIDFRSIIRHSGDKELIAKFDRLESLREQLDGYYRLSVKEQKADPDRMKRDIYSLERTIVNECKEYGSFTDNLSIDAARVSQALADDEAAVEFTDIYVHGRGNTYLAFILRKGQPTPKMVRLFSDDDLEEFTYGGKALAEALQSRQGIDSVYSDKRLGGMMWQPLMKELCGVRRVFFSPSSLFYQLAVEYMPCDSAHRISDIYELHRVSSTKLLAMRTTEAAPVTKATVYGGLNFDMDLAQLKEQHNMRRATAATELMMAMAHFDTTRALDSLATRGSVSFLPGSMREAESVGEQLMQNGVETDMLIGDEGTEETFKALSGQQRSVIHIATHGFYFSEDDLMLRKQKLVFLADDEEDGGNPLNYSGLLLSGANYVLNGGQLPEDIEDGVLTSNEIAHTDLGKTDLVVLSACQTGVGDIRDDGVFGIQRGFKKAGAHSLIMSLWSVDDEATDKMMTKFYEKLMEGKSKQQAFREAQHDMRQGYYGEPFYWAPFILLDGF